MHSILKKRGFCKQVPKNGSNQNYRKGSILLLNLSPGSAVC